MTLRIALITLLVGAACRAGGSPETTLVVVNADSPVSRRIANEYVDLRGIPDGHLLYLSNLPTAGVIPLDTFLERIWTPIHAHLTDQHLQGEIDLITYSADFPYGVDFRDRLPKVRPQGPNPVGGIASLTGVTYLIRQVEARNPFWNLQINRYFRLSAGGRKEGRRANSEERALFAKAQQALQRKQYQAAVEATGKVLETYTGSAQVWFLHSMALAALGRKDDALEAIGKAADCGPLNADAVQRNLAPLAGDPRFGAILTRLRRGGISFLPAHGFHSDRAWVSGRPVEDPESVDRYYLSTMLGWTGLYGNSVPEVLACLRSARQSDGTRPDGQVYICKNGNVRSTAREPFFGTLVEALERMDRKVEILDATQKGQTGILPVGKTDVIGAVVGSASFRWASTRSTLLPGAIAEHLTSFGAHFGTPGQTKLSEFLRYGAAGSSGTVMEPLALHQKFPNPMVHAFYAEGCSLAEAYYQSVWGPYQLLVVGDGLAQPFARFAAEAKVNRGPYRGQVAFEAKGELWIDGRLSDRGDRLEFDSRELDEGHHDFRLVTVADDDVGTRSVTRWNGEVRNSQVVSGEGAQYSGEPRRELHGVLVFQSSEAGRIEVLHAGRVVGSGDSRCEVTCDQFGLGPVTLVPRLVLASAKGLRSKPVRIEFVAPKPIGSRVPDHPRFPGLRGTVDTADGEQAVVVTHLGDARSGLRLRERLAPLKPKRVTLEGEIEVKDDGWYQLRFSGKGLLRNCLVAGEMLIQAAEVGGNLHRELSLAAGWHPIRFEFEPGDGGQLELLIGGDQVLAAPRLRHFRYPALKSEPVVVGAEQGKPISVPAEGLVLEWKRTARDVAAIVVVPAPKSATFPRKWIVEYATSRKYKPVQELSVMVARPQSKPKEGEEIPAFVELSFKPVKAKRIRIRPASGAATLQSVRALAKEKRK